MELQGLDSSDEVVVTATATGAAQPVLQDQPAYNLSGLETGTYDFVFHASGQEIERLDGVCLLGRLTGCDALGPCQAETPPTLIRIGKEAGVLKVELVHQNQCPQ